MAAAQYPLRDGQTLEPLVTRRVGIDGPHAEIKLLDESGAQAASLERLSIGTGNNFCSACLLRLNQEGAVLIGVFGRDRGDKRAIWPAA